MQNSGGPEQSQTRNMILAVVISATILIGWQVFYEGPRLRKLQAEQARIEEQTRTQGPATTTATGGDGATPAQAATRPREEVLAQTSAERVAIDTPSVDGSIALQGARIDDLSLRGYTRNVDPQSGEVSLLAPEGAEHSFDAFFGWEDRDEHYVGIGDEQIWTAEAGARLTPQTPLQLHYASPDGLEVTRTIAVDENYMFTITDEVRNTGPTPRSVRPFGVVRRQGLPEDYINRQIVHQGFAGAFGPNNHLNTFTYQRANKHAQDRTKGKVGEQERLTEQQGTGGWLGITDHYWLTAIVLNQNEPMSGYFDSKTEGATTDYRAAYRGDWRQIAPGGSMSYTQSLFAGAKRVDLLQQYQKGLNIPRFDEAVDWGNMTYWLTRAYFMLLLHPLAKLIGGVYGFGFAILLSTVVIKLLLFPLVYHSFKSMAKMRAIVPKQKEIQERYAADKARQQQEMIKLYQTEKINPVSGCLPILLQIPVFFALYKTLSVTIEMRHAPFIGWIHDLSAPDPTSIFNLFGLLPYDPHTLPVVGAFLAIGVLPILYGISMWALQALSPPPPDPTQAQIFRLLPILFTFMFAGFPAGLVLYWTWSNSLSILQQYVIMRRQGVETQFDKFLARLQKAAEGMIAFSDDEIEAGRLLFAGPVNFERGVVDMDTLPDGELPEVAFAGRSNVGKSSLSVNALTGRTALARASAAPGRTRELNFFRVGDTLRVVDLPGYGYAKAPKVEIERWTGLTRDYLRGRAPLKRVILLIDSRHGLKPHDKDVMDALDSAAVAYQIVLTKSDKLKPSELVACVAATAELIAKRPAAHPHVLATSAETGLGVDILRAEIAALAGV